MQIETKGVINKVLKMMLKKPSYCSFYSYTPLSIRYCYDRSLLGDKRRRQRLRLCFRGKTACCYSSYYRRGIYDFDVRSEVLYSASSGRFFFSNAYCRDNGVLRSVHSVLFLFSENMRRKRPYGIFRRSNGLWAYCFIYN